VDQERLALALVELDTLIGLCNFDVTKKSRLPENHLMPQAWNSKSNKSMA
jgi:hypothetical protein